VYILNHAYFNFSQQSTPKFTRVTALYILESHCFNLQNFEVILTVSADIIQELFFKSK